MRERAALALSYSLPYRLHIADLGRISRLTGGRMNLWIGSRATHWTDNEIVHVYCVMDGVFIVSDYYDTKAEAEKALDEIIEMARFVVG